MKKMQAALIAAGAAMAGGLLLSGCQSGGRECPREAAAKVQAEQQVDRGTADMTRRKVSRPLTKFDGADFVTIHDSAPKR